MTVEKLRDLFLRRQSCRSFSGAPVPETVVKEICRLAALSPSACNAQPWQMIAVVGEKCKELAPCMQRFGMNKFASNAGAFVVIVAKKGNLTTKISGSEEQFIQNDVGMMTAHLVLAAESMGVQSCILGWRNEKSLCKVLSLPEKTHIPHVIALGYATEGYEIRPKKRKSFEDVYKLVK